MLFFFFCPLDLADTSKFLSKMRSNSFLSMRSEYCNLLMYVTGSRREGGWKERMDDWKWNQGNLGAESYEAMESDMPMYVIIFAVT